MLVLIAIENGVKKIIPLTADAGAGNPVGSLLHTYKKSNTSGYLYCDGSTFDQTKYPLLYAYLGSNVLPDYRECVEVGAEQNTTDTIATHDVYTEGQFKDDQLQDHEHEGKTTEGAGGSNVSKIIGTSGTPYGGSGLVLESYRHGTTTHGKQKAVFVYIKATSGLSENAQDNVINTLNEQRSYSTEEHLTGRKWLDGKPTYEKTIDCGVLPNSTAKYVAHGINNLKKVIKSEGFSDNNAGTNIPVPYVSGNPLAISVDTTSIIIQASSDYSNFVNTQITLEYTKTN